MNMPKLLSHGHSSAYGFLAMPLAFVALPMYVNLPHVYATQYAVPLTSLGLVLLTSRLLDAFVDPGLGRMSDALYRRSVRAVLMAATLLALLLLGSFVALFFPPKFEEVASYVGWVTVCVSTCHLSFSGLSILHQAWATRLGGGQLQQSRVLAWREGLGLWGVVLASLLPALVGWTSTAISLGVMLGLGLVSWRWVMHSTASQQSPEQPPEVKMSPASSMALPWQQAAFRKLLIVFLLNGIASAVPASLVMFFVEDQIRASAAMAPWFLGVYFLSGVLSLPGWLYAIRKFDLPKAWAAGMVLALIAFASVMFLGPGDELAFLFVCCVSGLALGADMVAPSALLNRVIDQLGHRGEAEGVYLGWWNLISKFNLALAAGLCLPLLSFWGYTPGVHSPQGLHALSLAYGLLPCVLKACALSALIYFWIQPSARELTFRSDV
jgi:GPH family glycoside/pentoside/hexuronide:cation symporter